MKKTFSLATFALVCILFITGCAEHRYYAQHRDHSARWYRHHPHHHPSVDVNIHN